MTTGYAIHGWKKGTRICRDNRFKGTVMSDGEYYSDLKRGVWYFKVQWDNGSTVVTVPMAYDEILKEKICLGK